MAIMIKNSYILNENCPELSCDDILLLEMASYYVQNKSSLRKTAHHFGVNYVTFWRKMLKKLPKISSDLYGKVRERLEINKEMTKFRTKRSL